MEQLESDGASTVKSTPIKKIIILIRTPLLHATTIHFASTAPLPLLPCSAAATRGQWRQARRPLMLAVLLRGGQHAVVPVTEEGVVVVFGVGDPYASGDEG
jgi:hypothetical protein